MLKNPSGDLIVARMNYKNIQIASVPSAGNVISATVEVFRHYSVSMVQINFK